MKALVYLAVRRFINSLKRVPSQPRLLLPYILFGLFFASQIVLYLVARRAGMQRFPTGGLSPAFTPKEYIEGGPGAMIAAVRGILILNVFTTVVTALGEGNLFFAQSDVDFLFPAPLKRRQVLLFKMLARYAGMILPAAYLPLLMGGALVAAAGVHPVGYLPGVLGAWLFLVTTANLAQVVLLGRREAQRDGEVLESDRRRERLRSAVAVGLSLLAFTVLGLLVFAATRGMRPGLLRDLLRLVNSEVVSWVLLPVAWASDLFRVAFEGWTWAAVGRLLGLVLLAGASLLLLFFRDRDFYEGAMDFSQRTGQMQRAVQQGDAGTILSRLASEGKITSQRTVRAFGDGALAILWKDAVFFARTPWRSWLTLLFVAAFPAIGPLLPGGRREGLGILFWLVLFTVTTTSLFLLGLRDMLRRADITKALPIAPVRLLMAELAFSVLQMTLLGWFSMALMALLGTAGGPTLGAAFIAFPTLTALMLPVQTIFLLLYPAPPGDAAQSGVGSLLSMLASTLALVPSIVIGGMLHLTGAGLLLTALGVSLTNLATAAVAFGVAALCWQRFDPTD